MDAKTLKILKTIYGKLEHQVWDNELHVTRYAIPATVKRADVEWLTAQGVEVNRVERFEHDDVLRRARALTAKCDFRELARAFVAGVGGSSPRSRQPLISYVKLRSVSKHQAEPNTVQDGPSRVCQICKVVIDTHDNVAPALYGLEMGGCWNEFPHHFVYDLEDYLARPIALPLDSDWTTLRDLLKLVEQAPSTETPGALERRLNTSRALPKTNKYSRYGILLGLSELGVLPNSVIAPAVDGFVDGLTINAAYKEFRAPTRSDIPVPLGAWRGANGVDWERVRAVFPEL